ncbi:FAD-linked oxidase C-terminal domain-containing protein [Sinorhizobium sp. BJ1]|nr:FAD-linked oxidase C-terminal domain-containing protein [Sinorhizobium sp. BJ1]
MACGAALREAFPSAHISFFGHVADSNLHIALLGAGRGRRDATRGRRDRLCLVDRYHGAISAEHGIGILKRDFLDRSRSPAELEVMRRIKTALDPNGILNPGKVLGR